MLPNYENQAEQPGFLDFQNMKSRDYLVLFAVIFLAKIVIIIIVHQVGNDFFGTGNDSEYYHEYAIGDTDEAVNAWPIILRSLNDISLYSRDGLGVVLKVIGFILIPVAVGMLSQIRTSRLRTRVFWASAVVVSAYPTVIYYTVDIYRDVFMLFVWLLGLFVFKALSSEQSRSRKASTLLIGLGFSFILYELRPYLGLAYFTALLFSGHYSFRRYSIITVLSTLILVLFLLYLSGALEPVLKYRAWFVEEGGGGSNIGIGFSSPESFFPDLLATIAFQLFGLYLINPSSIIVLITESIPFVVFLFYVIKNKFYSSKFVDYLIVFFIVYSAIWLLGNDNLGTAVRLRVFNYISIIIAFFIVYQNKDMSRSKKSLPVN